MSIRTMARSSSNRNSASARASSVFPTPVGPRNTNEPIGLLGSESPARVRRMAFAPASTASCWSTTRLCSSSSIRTSFCISPSMRRDTGMPVHVEPPPPPSSSSTSSFSILRSRWISASFAFSSSMELASSTSLPYRSSAARSRSPSPSARSRPHPLHVALPPVPVGLHGARTLLEVRQVRLQAGQPVLRRVVRLLPKGCPLDLELLHPPLDLVDLRRHRVDLDPKPGRGLVDEIDRLVGEEPTTHVPAGKHGRRDQGGILDPDPVVHLVPLLQTPKDGDGVLDRGLLHQDGLEPALQRRVLLYMLAVLIERGRTDRPELASGEHGLQHVAGVDRTFCRARAYDRVQFVDERDDLALALGDLPQHRLEPLLELAPVLRARDQCPDVQGDHAFVLQRFGHVPGHDPLSQSLDDGCLPHPGLADQHRVVLRPSREHLDDPAYLVVPAYDGIH